MLGAFRAGGAFCQKTLCYKYDTNKLTRVCVWFVFHIKKTLPNNILVHEASVVVQHMLTFYYFVLAAE